MRDTLRNVLGTMTESDFFFNNPSKYGVCNEQHFTTRLYSKFENYVRENRDIFPPEEIAVDRIGLQYNQVKNSREFAEATDRHGYERAMRIFSELLNDCNGSVIPDLCYHNPENIDHNKLVVEVKCDYATPYNIYHDLRKMRLYTDPSILNFQTGIFLHVFSPYINPIASITRWASQLPRTIPNRNIQNYDRLRNELDIETPAPVAGASFYIWRIRKPPLTPEGVFNLEGFFTPEGLFDTNRIEEIEVNPNSFDGYNFV